MIQEKYKKQLDELIDEEKRLGKYTLVVPLTMIGEGRWSAEGVDGQDEIVEIAYDETMGLLVGEEVGVAL